MWMNVEKLFRNKVAGTENDFRQESVTPRGSGWVRSRSDMRASQSDNGYARTRYRDCVKTQEDTHGLPGGVSCLLLQIGRSLPGCHGACPVEIYVYCFVAQELAESVTPPQRRAVAAQNAVQIRCSCKHEPPSGKPRVSSLSFDTISTARWY